MWQQQQKPDIKNNLLLFKKKNFSLVAIADQHMPVFFHIIKRFPSTFKKFTSTKYWLIPNALCDLLEIILCTLGPEFWKCKLQLNKITSWQCQSANKTVNPKTSLAAPSPLPLQIDRSQSMSADCKIPDRLLGLGDANCSIWLGVGTRSFFFFLPALLVSTVWTATAKLTVHFDNRCKTAFFSPPPS